MYNSLCAIAVTRHLGVNVDTLTEVIKRCQGKRQSKRAYIKVSDYFFSYDRLCT